MNVFWDSNASYLHNLKIRVHVLPSSPIDYPLQSAKIINNVIGVR